jgi:hypothetical protein
LVFTIECEAGEVIERVTETKFYDIGDNSFATKEVMKTKKNDKK